MQQRWNARRETLGTELGLARAELGVGVGIHCGELSFGEFGRSHRDLTAIGTVVNLASRAQSAAAAGEILVTQAVYERAQPELAGSRPQQRALKGFEEPTTLYAA
jgi:class 3 adenylate cyclase